MKFEPAIVVPTYNNGGTLQDVLRRICGLGVPVFVVNDGSTDDTAAILADFEQNAGVEAIAHDRNRGKAAALRSGFDAARARGFTHAVSIDSDGQHDPADIPRLLDAARRAPQALVLGTRDESAENYPARSRTGRIVSNAFIRAESGLRVSDSQCGLRIYPLDFVAWAGCRAQRFGFETEIVTRAGWAGVEIRELPVSCRYAQPGEHRSHFKPWRDSLAAVPMHARLVGRAILPWPHAKLHESKRAGDSIHRRMMRWLSPRRAWRELKEQPEAPREMATGLAVGAFIANLPIYGLQTMLSIYTARRLHLNPLTVVAGSHISTPPLGPILIAVGIGVGHLILHGTWLTPPAWPGDFAAWVRLCGTVLLEWTVGALIVGTIVAGAMFCVSHTVLRRVAVGRN